MKAIDAQEAGKTLLQLIEEAASTHQPIQITSAPASAVLIAEEDWRAVQETLYLLAIPGMRESIREGLTTPIDACAKSVIV